MSDRFDYYRSDDDWSGARCEMCEGGFLKDEMMLMEAEDIYLCEECAASELVFRCPWCGDTILVDDEWVLVMKDGILDPSCGRVIPFVDFSVDVEGYVRRAQKKAILIAGGMNPALAGWEAQRSIGVHPKI